MDEKKEILTEEELDKVAGGNYANDLGYTTGQETESISDFSNFGIQ